MMTKIWSSMKVFIIFLSLLSLMFGARAVESTWAEGKTFSGYLVEHNVSVGLIQNIDPDDMQFLSEIRNGEKFHELFSKYGTLLQSLIPIGEEMQIQIVRDREGKEYSFDIVPIHYTEHEHKAVVPIQSNPQKDLLRATNNRKLSNRINYFFKNNIDCRRLLKDDTLAVIYKQKERLGKPFGSPDVKIAMIETRKKRRFIYADNDGLPTMKICKAITYDSQGNQVSSAQIRKRKNRLRFDMPLRHIRISSRFSYKRWHPILHRYRPHLGTDFAGRRGTPILAVNSGSVTFSGWKGGYGKVVKIKHRGGYTSLYAHQSRIRVKKGQKVKKGQVIGYVGNTGRSTGPHLHFGLYRYGRAIDPMKVLTKKSSGKLSFITKKIWVKGAKKNKARVLKMLKNPPNNFKWDIIEKNYTLVKDKKHYIQNIKG